MAMTDEERKAKGRAYQKQWRLDNPGKSNEYTKKWRLENPEKNKENYDKQNKRQYEKDMADGFKRQREYKEKNAESIAARMKAYCAARRPKLSEQGRRAAFKAKYGMTHEDRDMMLAAQGSCCEICKATSPGNKYGWVVDHCHKSNKVRAILCHHCNLGLGNFKDSPEILHAMIAYLEKHSG